MIGEITECLLLVISLVITILALIKVRNNYSKIKPEMNIFDVVLEIVSLCGVYAYHICALIAIFYTYYKMATDKDLKDKPLQNYMDYIEQFKPSQVYNSIISSRAGGYDDTSRSTTILLNTISMIASILSLIQTTFQTLLILECLRRYAYSTAPFMNKPARELITVLLLINVSFWLYDSVSTKRFNTKPFNVEHFGIMKWSIINAFSAPLAIFYRFHSSVCLSDIWYGLYYGEHETEHETSESDNQIGEPTMNTHQEFSDFSRF
jgi:hypothetical protein